MPGMEEEDIMLEPHLTLEEIQSLKGKQIMDRQKDAERLACTAFGDIADEFFAMRERIADLENQLAAANQEIHRFVSECGRCGCSGQKAEHTIFCPECLAWYREEWGAHTNYCQCRDDGKPCEYCLCVSERRALKAEVDLLTDKLIAASNAKANAKEKLMEISGIDSGSVEAEAREKIQQIGYAETLRRVGDCGKWSLTWESVSNVLELLQEGIISRRKCHETLNSILHGESTNLPELENTAFDDVELPGETVRQLRRSAFELSNDLDMAQGKLDQALAELDQERQRGDENYESCERIKRKWEATCAALDTERKNGLALACIILSGSIDRTAKEAEKLLAAQRKAGAVWALMNKPLGLSDRTFAERIERGEVEVLGE